MAMLKLRGNSCSSLLTDMDEEGPIKTALNKLQTSTRITLERLIVAVRIRPFNKGEMTRTRHFAAATATNPYTIKTDEQIPDDDVLRKARQKSLHHRFDRVFDENASQEYVFEHTLLPMLDVVFNGINMTCFVYGATGSGKTHTMMGSPGTWGIIPQTLQYLFGKVCSAQDSNHPYKLAVTFVEIYNENIHDLINGSSDCLEVWDDANKGTFISGASIVPVTTLDEVLYLLSRGNKFRHQKATGANAVSSRSHAIFQISVTSFGEGSNCERVGKLSLIDLAGSERAKVTKNQGARMVEGANINRSLLALGNCINSLATGSVSAKYVNFRDSKLTRLLKDSLAGNSITVMIANISPSELHYDETINTLKYATRVRGLTNTVTENFKSKKDVMTAKQMRTLALHDGKSVMSTRKSSYSGMSMLNIPARELEKKASSSSLMGDVSNKLKRQASKAHAQKESERPWSSMKQELIESLKKQYEIKRQMLKQDRDSSSCDIEDVLELKTEAEIISAAIRKKFQDLLRTDESQADYLQLLLEVQRRDIHILLLEDKLERSTEAVRKNETELHASIINQREIHPKDCEYLTLDSDQTSEEFPFESFGIKESNIADYREII